MQTTLKELPDSRVEVQAEVAAEDVQRAANRTARVMARELRLPGFRKGKAPRNIIEKTVGVDNIKREALEQLVPELLGKAIVDENLDVITEPEIDTCNFELGSPLKLTDVLDWSWYRCD